MSYLQDEVDDLEAVIINIKSENKNLKNKLEKIKILEKELSIMRTKMDSISQLPGALYSQAHTYFDSGQFEACMNLLILLSEEYPDWDRQKVENKYNLANKKKLKIEKEQLRLKKINERKQQRASQMVDSIRTNVESIYDEKTGETYFRTLRSTLCQVAHTVSFGIELYMIVNKDGDREFRVKSTYIDKSGSDYHDPQWMNYNKIELLSDNNKRIIINVNKISAIGLLIKSIGFLTFIIEVLSFPSIISPNTIPKIIGTIGKSTLLRINPKTPKPAATAQSVKLLRKL